MKSHSPMPLLASLLSASLWSLQRLSLNLPSRRSRIHRLSTWGFGRFWHDKEVTVSPAHEAAAMLRLCEGCAPVPLTAPIQIRAVADRVDLPRNRQPAAVSVNGSFTLAAHGETIHAAETRFASPPGTASLFSAVMLPVETYVERVVASESGPADTPESLKALAVVVRSFALASSARPRRLQRVRLHPLPTAALVSEPRAPERRSRRHSCHGRRNTLVSRAARGGLVSSELRRPHRFAARGVALGGAGQRGAAQADALAGFSR